MPGAIQSRSSSLPLTSAIAAVNVAGIIATAHITLSLACGEQNRHKSAPRGKAVAMMNVAGGIVTGINALKKRGCAALLEWTALRPARHIGN